MLEILIVWRLLIFVGNIAAEKGLRKIGYQVMAVLCWVGGEISGAIIGYAIVGDSAAWRVYLLALIGALLGAGLAFLVMRLVPAQPRAVDDLGQPTVAEITSGQRFGRSAWVPVLTVLSVIACLCLSVGGSALITFNQVAQNQQSSDPWVGVEYDETGVDVYPTNEIDPNQETIYFSFNNTTRNTGKENTLSFDWYIDDQLFRTVPVVVPPGRQVIPFERTDFFEQNWQPGRYQVTVLMGEKILASVRFDVKW